MPLTIQTIVNPVGPAVMTDQATLNRLFRAEGRRIPQGAKVVGITIPALTIDQTDLHFKTRNNGMEFQFDLGTLKLTLNQSIYLLKSLHVCERTVWLQHEFKHVRDNEEQLKRLEGELRTDKEFAGLLVKPTEWHLRLFFQNIQDKVYDLVSERFKRLTRAAGLERDSVAEYHRTEQQARMLCGKHPNHEPTAVELAAPVAGQ